VELRFDVEENHISDAQIFSDAMDSSFILEAAEKLRGCPFSLPGLAEKLVSSYEAGSEYRGYAEDIAAMIFT
jgi:hypothetical protein